MRARGTEVGPRRAIKGAESHRKGAGHRVYPFTLPDLVYPATCARAARCTAEKCISQRFGNLWRTDNGGRQSYPLRSPFLLLCPPPPPPSHPPIPIYPSFPFAPASIISLLCLGKRVAQYAATSQFSGSLDPPCPAFSRRGLQGSFARDDHPG